MRSARRQPPGDPIAERADDPSHDCPSADGDGRPATACRRHSGDGDSSLELRVYLPRRAWWLTVTRERATRVEFRGSSNADDGRDQIAAPSVL
jgi:hypothetical protein